MIGKHIDLIAIGVLLFGIACYSHARSIAALEVVHGQRITITQHYRQPRVVIPKIPRIRYTND